jgi:protein AroM
MDPTIAFLTIGQAPRHDIVPSILSALPRARAVEAGALDGLDAAAVAALAPQDDDLPLVTHANGGAVVVGKRAILPRLQGLIDRLNKEVDVFVILCTGGFAPFKATKPVVFPDRLLKGAVSALWSTGVLGVVAPLEGQIAMNREVWSSYPLAIEVASPYAEGTALESAGDRLRQRGASLIVLNCMGFSEAMKAQVRQGTGLPVLLPSTVTGHLIGACL